MNRPGHPGRHWSGPPGGPRRPPRRLIYPHRDGTAMDRIDHIGVAVQGLEEALKPWVEGLGLRAAPIEELPTERVRVW